ncbi:uncharacterized protein N7511_005793 [Penicillium nucicola]|uniref:uncharacterized protein n=1 Tax=Penicillium nucicola TaxID=1850975 RepID=UPI002545BBF0|nr:uncharacterized protein N7511_005793 [Penicillium nucicola]KAJ5762411.1 hypothetical protein N7511_005793 [Penicillium nucicola]
MSQEALAKVLAAPALVPPPGVTANFDNPPNGNTLAWAVTTFCTVVITLCMFLRVFARLWLDKRIRIEEGEWTNLPWRGAYWGTAYASYALISSPGYFVHTWDLTKKDLIRPLFLILVYGCSYSTVIPLIKIAILIGWCRVFVAVDRSRNLFWWGCMFVSCIQCAWGVACIILLNMQCTPHEAIWLFYLPSKCYPLSKILLVSSSIQIISDIVMFILPQKIIWGLQMNWQKKLGVSIIFGVGLSALVTACFRLSHTIIFANQPDSMYFIGPLLFWAFGEMTCGFFIFSMPFFSKLIIKSDLPSRVKRALGDNGAKNSNLPFENRPSQPSGPGSGSEGFAKPWMKRRHKNPETTWSQLDDDAIPLGNTGLSESRENLHLRRDLSEDRKSGSGSGNENGTGGIQVMHTTNVTVSREPSAGSELSSITPWVQKG